jgi:hypothetical protein
LQGAVVIDTSQSVQIKNPKQEIKINRSDLLEDGVTAKIK